jgi:hypothetical protein
MKVALLNLLVAAIATETLCAQGIFIRPNNGNHVWALFDEESMSLSADYMVSISLSFGGIEGGKAEKSGGSDDSSMSMGKASKMGKGGLMMSMGKAGKGSLMMNMGKSGKVEPKGKSGKAEPPSYSPTFSPTVSVSPSCEPSKTCKAGPPSSPTVSPRFSPTFYHTLSPSNT